MSLASPSQTQKSTLNNAVMDAAFERTGPSGSLHCDERHKGPVDDSQNDHSLETVSPGLIDGSLDSPLYNSDMQYPHQRRSLDISVEKDPFLDRLGVPPIPHNTPASNSEGTSRASSEAGSCRARDCQPVAAPKAESPSVSCLDGSEGMHDGHKDKGHVNVLGRRIQLKELSLTNSVFTPVSPPLGTMDHSAEKLNDTTPPRLRSPQFSPASSFFGPPRIQVRSEASPGWKHGQPSTERRKLPIRKPRHRHRHTQRPFPSRAPMRTSIPTEHTDRFPIPFPSILNLPLHRKSCELVTSANQNEGIRSGKSLLLGSVVWQRLRECAMIRLSLHKALPSSDPHSISYLLYLRVSRSTFSVKFSYTTKPDKRTLSPALSAPTDGATMILFQASLFIPLVVLGAIDMASSSVRGTLGSKVVRMVVSAVAGRFMAVISWLVLFAMRMFRLWKISGLVGAS